MQYTSHYISPIGNILLAADEIGLTGLWFEGQKYFARCLNSEHIEKKIDIFKDTKKWLDIYDSSYLRKERRYETREFRNH